MKKVTLLSAIIFSTGLFITGCQKKSDDINSENASVAARSDNSSGCRMTQYYYYDAISDVAQVDNFTYKNGLVDEWVPSYGWVFKMEYTASGKMKAANVFENDVQVARVEFIWQNGKLIKEVWYQPNTDIVDDEWVNTYDHRGNIIRNESSITGLYTLYTYDQTGQMKSWQFFEGDVPIVKGDYTSDLRYKNPYKSVSGIEYFFAYVNGGAWSSQAWYASEKLTFYDLNGDPSVYYDLDPQQTVWHVGQQNYPVHVEYTDAISNGSVTTTFAYENCNPGESSRASLRIADPASRKSNDVSLKAILSGPKKDLVKRINAFRSKLKNNNQRLKLLL